jgi:hypothetical protein
MLYTFDTDRCTFLILKEGYNLLKAAVGVGIGKSNAFDIRGQVGELEGYNAGHSLPPPVRQEPLAVRLKNQ